MQAVGVEHVVEAERPRDDDPVEGLVVVEHEEGVDVVHFGGLMLFIGVLSDATWYMRRGKREIRGVRGYIVNERFWN